MKTKIEKKNLKGKLTLKKETITHLTHQSMAGVYGGTCEACESMLFSCDPEKWYCGPGPDLP